MAKTVFDVLKEKIEADIVSAKDFLAGGGAKDFSQYIQDLSRNYLEGDDD